MTVPVFRVVSIAEAVSWLVLIAATIAKRAFDVHEATAVIGPIHGVIFLAYAACVVFLREELDWSLGRTAVAIVASVIPLGAYLIVERRYLSEPAVAAAERHHDAPAERGAEVGPDRV
jgi:integral membrane protein